MREAQILEQDQRELREAQERLAMRQEEKRLCKKFKMSMLRFIILVTFCL